MNSPPDFKLKIAKEVHSPEEGPGITSIIIRQPYAHLEKELSSAFKGEEDVKVIVDGRYVERRKSRQAVEIERRRAGRRRPKEELVEVVIST